MKSNKQSKQAEQSERVLLGKIVGAQGIRGEVKIYAFGDAPSDFNKYEKALVVLLRDAENDGTTSEAKADIEQGNQKVPQREIIFTIDKARISGSLAIVKFDEIDDRNAAESLRDAEVFVDADELEELPEDTYYVRDLEGLTVIDDDTNEAAGEIVEVIQNAAQDVYRIALKSGTTADAYGSQEPGTESEKAGDEQSGEAKSKDTHEALVPAVKEFIKDVDIEAGTIRIHFIEGMR
ncbi:MAG: 16S rRNA processing protein RimM [Firmicutes bacterium]|nr:16S rRNA processing protein RimM [Bacillota bacterium]